MVDAEVNDKNSQLRHKDAKKYLSYITNRMTFRPNDVVLDFGCGDGFVTKNILLPLLGEIPEVKIYAVDISQEMIDFASNNYASPNIRYSVSDILKEEVGIPDRFDKIFSSFVLHWVPDQEQVLIIY